MAESREATLRKQRLFTSALQVSSAAGVYRVPPGLLWGSMLLAPLPPRKTLQSFANEVAQQMARVHAQTGSWETAVAQATGLEAANVREAQHRLPISSVLGEPSAQPVPDLILAAATFGAGLWAAVGGGAIGSSVGLAGGAAAGSAGAEAAAAGGAGAAGGAAEAAGAGAAGGGAASIAAKAASALSSLDKAGIAAAFVAGIAALISGYGLRLLEILAGVALVGFALVMLARRAPR